MPETTEWKREHTPHECGCGRTACMFCDGGLFACDDCDSFEGGTTTHCPGQRMTAERRDEVYAGHLDFREGQWVKECSPNAPGFWRTPEGQALIAEERAKGREGLRG